MMGQEDRGSMDRDEEWFMKVVTGTNTISGPRFKTLNVRKKFIRSRAFVYLSKAGRFDRRPAGKPEIRLCGMSLPGHVKRNPVNASSQGCLDSRLEDQWGKSQCFDMKRVNRPIEASSIFF
jgi:hypothetical protein